MSCHHGVRPTGRGWAAFLGVVGCIWWSASAHALQGAGEWYASPSGSSSGNGSLESPWDLATALGHPSAVKPGDTISLRGGVYRGRYRSRLNGTSGAPITVRSRPGEWAVLDGHGATGSDEGILWVAGSWGVYRDFEVARYSMTTREQGPPGIGTGSPNNKFVNLIVHDNGQGFGFWKGAVDSEVYGCIIYNNGWDGPSRGHGHGMYTQNADPARPKRIRDNIFFSGFGWPIHAYAEGGPLLGFHIEGNIWFLSGIASKVSGIRPSLVGGLTPAENIVLRNNIAWAPETTRSVTQLGYSSDDNKDVTLRGNYFKGATNFSRKWKSITMEGNTFYGPVNGVNTAAYPDNTYLASRPAGAKAFVRPNQYEGGRAHVAVFNWDLAASVSVDLSGVLNVGTEYEVRNAQNFFAPAVVSGTYDGNPVSLPMAGLEMVEPIAWPGAYAPSERTGPEFNVFVVLAKGGVAPPGPPPAGPPPDDGGGDGGLPGGGGGEDGPAGARPENVGSEDRRDHPNGDRWPINDKCAGIASHSRGPAVLLLLALAALGSRADRARWEPGGSRDGGPFDVRCDRDPSSVTAGSPGEAAGRVARRPL